MGLLFAAPRAGGRTKATAVPPPAVPIIAAERPAANAGPRACERPLNPRQPADPTARLPMHIAILTFQGFNELDSFIALGVLNRIKRPGWRVSICGPDPEVTSMNGLSVRSQSLLEEASTADAVIVGSGMRTREVVETPSLLSRIRLDPARQLVAAQCSGTLVLARLGLVDGIPACTDLTTKPWVVAAGVEVIDQPFIARGNVATAGGCLASSYLAAWVIARIEGLDAAAAALHYVAPVGEKEAFVANALRHIQPGLHAPKA